MRIHSTSRPARQLGYDKVSNVGMASTFAARIPDVFNACLPPHPAEEVRIFSSLHRWTRRRERSTLKELIRWTGDRLWSSRAHRSLRFPISINCVGAADHRRRRAGFETGTFRTARPLCPESCRHWVRRPGAATTGRGSGRAVPVSRVARFYMAAGAHHHARRARNNRIVEIVFAKARCERQHQCAHDAR